MRFGALFLTLLLAGCDPIPAGDPFSPVKVTKPAAAAPVAAPAGPDGATPAEPVGTTTGSFDFDGEDRKEDELVDGEIDPIEAQAGLLGVDPDSLTEPAPKAPVVQTVAAPALPTPVWQTDQPLDGSFGLRVIATLHDVQPPRAVIATADGEELVVQPGQMLPRHRMVVLAVGRDAVQVAHVTPQGFYARVQTETIAALAPAASAP